MRISSESSGQPSDMKSPTFSIMTPKRLSSLLEQNAQADGTAPGSVLPAEVGNLKKKNRLIRPLAGTSQTKDLSRFNNFVYLSEELGKLQRT
jgi:hypothetical protein